MLEKSVLTAVTKYINADSEEGAVPRQGRIDMPGSLHHIICRGIERRDIFSDDLDRDEFLSRLIELTTISLGGREMGMTEVVLARLFKASQPAVAQAVSRGEKLADENVWNFKRC